eukprot:c52225_g1_i1.p1 GENE.c52225_g1_i1~~c52225_g1_i1.p1  ORF type:complete len:642 (+),score=127.73 c52225_g1_i1:43-1968(+)
MADETLSPWDTRAGEWAQIGFAGAIILMQPIFWRLTNRALGRATGSKAMNKMIWRRLSIAIFIFAFLASVYVIVALMVQLGKAVESDTSTFDGRLKHLDTLLLIGAVATTVGFIAALQPTMFEYFAYLTRIEELKPMFQKQVKIAKSFATSYDPKMDFVYGAADERLGKSRVLYHQLIRPLLKGLFWFFTIILILVLSSFNGTAFIMGIGFLVSTGLSSLFFGFQFFQSLAGLTSIVLGDMFNVGDIITVGNTTGFVDRIALMLTVIRQFDGKIAYLPNSTFGSCTVENWTKRARKNVTLTVLVDYETPAKIADAFVKGVSARIKSDPGIDKDQYLKCQYISLAFGYELAIICYPSYGCSKKKLRSALIVDIMHLAQQLGVKITWKNQLRDRETRFTPVVDDPFSLSKADLEQLAWIRPATVLPKDKPPVAKAFKYQVTVKKVVFKEKLQFGPGDSGDIYIRILAAKQEVKTFVKVERDPDTPEETVSWDQTLELELEGRYVYQNGDVQFDLMDYDVSSSDDLIAVGYYDVGSIKGTQAAIEVDLKRQSRSTDPGGRNPFNMVTCAVLFLEITSTPILLESKKSMTVVNPPKVDPVPMVTMKHRDQPALATGSPKENAKWVELSRPNTVSETVVLLETAES